MKTLSDFKRALCVGSTWKIYNHVYGGLVCSMTVVEATSTRVRFCTDFCFYFPKASLVRFTDDNTAVVYSSTGRRSYTYSRVF